MEIRKAILYHKHNGNQGKAIQFTCIVEIIERIVLYHQNYGYQGETTLFHQI
jgi:hypothetical protein